MIREYTDHGVKASSLSSQITSHFKAQYIEMSASERESIKGHLLDALEACGLDREDAQERLADWEFASEYGFDYDNRKEAYFDGTVSREQLRAAIMEGKGKTGEEAEQIISELDFEKKYGFAYSDRKNAYLNGNVSAQELTRLLVDYGGKTEEEAEAQIEVYDWEKQGYEGATASNVTKYKEYCEPAGVPKDLYLQIVKFANNTENDVDEDGKTIYYSAVKKIMAQIGGLAIPDGQKEAIAMSLGWKRSTIDKYKTW